MSSGIIVIPPKIQNLLFQTDFSDLILATDSTGKPNYFRYSDGTNLPLRSIINYQETSARVAIVNDLEALGGKAVEIEVYEGMPTADRCDVDFYIQDLGVTNEFYVDSILKLNGDYDLTNPHDNPTWSPWHEIADLISEWAAGVPYYYIPLHVGKTLDGFKFTVSCRYAPNDGSSNTLIWSETNAVDLPRGEAFHLKYYVFRHPSEGIVKLWLDDVLIFNISGVPTMFRQNFFLIPEKVYGGEVLPEKKIWMEQLSIYDTEPQ
jgi:hypothetical protein